MLNIIKLYKYIYITFNEISCINYNLITIEKNNKPCINYKSNLTTFPFIII